MHHLTPERLETILTSSEAAALSAPAKERLAWIAMFVTGKSSVSEVCLRYGIARSTFHRWIDRFDPNDLSTLEEKARAPLATRSPVIEQRAIELIREYRQSSPLMGKEKIRTLLMSEHGMDVSSSTIGRVIEREGLYFASTPLHWKKRTSYKSHIANQESRAEEVAVEQPTIETPIRTHETSSSCDCFWCTFWRGHGTFIRRSIVLASVAINIVLISGYIATALWEQRGNSMQADLLTHERHTVSNLDAPLPHEQ